MSHFTYAPLRQLPYCCVAACVLMVLNRRKLDRFSQPHIGYALGLAVPPEFRTKFPKSRKKKPSSGWGTEVENPKYSLNHFFTKNNLPLHETCCFPKTISELQQVLQQHIGKADLLVCIQVVTWGHVLLVKNFSDSTVTLIDPATAKTKKVSLRVLFNSIQRHGKANRAGVWVISDNSPVIHRRR